MDIVSSGWSNCHKDLNSMIRKKDGFEKSIELILDLHKELHTSIVSNSQEKNAIDTLLGDLLSNELAIMPSTKDETIAWAIWHITRIEDLTMNILVNNDVQVFDDSHKKRLCISISDTGNAMSDDEIINFSKQVCMDELLRYRDEVGRKSRFIIQNLKPEDMKRRVTSEAIARILQEGGVTKQENSIWLLDFWGKKDVAGIILMPLTRHQTLHLNDICKWKKSIRKK